MPTYLPITSYSACSAIGSEREAMVAALATGRSGLGVASMALPFATSVGEIANEFMPLPPDLAPWDTRLARMIAWLLSELAGDIARAKDRWGARRIGVLLGTSNAGILTTEAAQDALRKAGKVPDDFDFARQHAYDGVLTVARRLTGIAGPCYVVSTACSSSAKVLAAASRLIAAGVIDAAVVGGADTLCQTTLRGFHGLGVLSPRVCRPFGANRDGISIGEGGALLLLERRGEARALLLGVGETSDAHHISAPHPEGLGARAAMAQALAIAGIGPDAVDHVNAHGTGTALNDAAEAAAVASLLGCDVPVASTKGYTGHLLGAAGAMEAVLAILAIEEGLVPANLGANPIDPALAVHVPSAPLRLRCRKVLSNSFAFGGNNTSVLLGAA